MEHKKGFTLLIAIITTSMLLIISFVIVNVALKQLVLASSSRESQFAYYNAESGVECAMYWDFKNGTVSAFDRSISTNVASCAGSALGSTGGAATTTFTINFTKGCAVVSVGKTLSTTTYINSKGYNVCPGGAQRRFERGIQITY
jgi:Tfp pilus assembly protein PilX